MSEIRIKQANQEKIYRYVIQALGLFDPETKSLHDDNIYKFSRIVYIMGNLIDIRGYPYNNDQKRGLISNGIRRFNLYKRKSLSLLVKALETEIRQLRRRPSVKFFVIFPWNLSYQSLQRKRHFVLEGAKLKTRQYAYVMKHFDFTRPFRHLMQRRGEIPGSIRDFTYIIEEVYSKNPIDAFHVANRRVELLRSLFNFVLSYGKITWQFGQPSPLSRIDPPKYMFLFNEAKQFRDYWFNMGEHKYRLLRLRNDELEVIKKSIVGFERLRDNKLKDVLIDCLKLYGYALDEIERGYIFLSLWQILEIVALKEPGGISLDRVKSRIKTIFRNNVVISDVLNAVFRKRNQLVHEGKLANFSLEDVNQIKGIAEGCIQFLFSHVNELKTKAGLRDFYENLNLDNSKLQKKMAVLRYVKKIRT